MNLTELADKYNTDKHYHGYTGVYEVLFEKIRLDVKNILEIGIQHGYSLYMWRDYFPNAIIHGIDINQIPIITDNRIKVYYGDQSDINFLNTFNDKKFDIIIDDGSHLHKDQVISLNVLQDFLVDGGYYIIEDINWNDNWGEWLHHSIHFIGAVRTSPTMEQMFILRR